MVWGYDKLAQEAWGSDLPDLVLAGLEGCGLGYDKLARRLGT